jgi:hypothetical protein
MTREMMSDFAKLVAQTAIGQALPAHFGVADELPSLFHSLLQRMDREDALRVTARFPARPTSRAIPAAAAMPKSGSTTAPGETAVTNVKRKAAALLARAEEVRTTADGMRDAGAREAMFRLAETYEKIARSINKSGDGRKDPMSDIG